MVHTRTQTRKATASRSATIMKTQRARMRQLKPVEPWSIKIVKASSDFDSIMRGFSTSATVQCIRKGVDLSKGYVENEASEKLKPNEFWMLAYTTKTRSRKPIIRGLIKAKSKADSLFIGLICSNYKWGKKLFDRFSRYARQRGKKVTLESVSTARKAYERWGFGYTKKDKRGKPSKIRSGGRDNPSYGLYPMERPITESESKSKSKPKAPKMPGVIYPSDSKSMSLSRSTRRSVTKSASGRPKTKSKKTVRRSARLVRSAPGTTIVTKRSAKLHWGKSQKR